MRRRQKTFSPYAKDGACIMTELRFLDREGGEKLAYRQIPAKAGHVAHPGLVWVGGYRSDMEGTKAAFLADWAAQRGLGFLRFDYFAHGSSSGDFSAATISRWHDDARAVLDRLTTGKQILIGSSMGGWISNLLMRTRKDRIAGVVWLAPAPDFSDDLMWDLLPPEAKNAIAKTGSWEYSDETGTYPITREFIEDGRNNFVLDKPFSADFPVRILHGMVDKSVPWQRSLKLVDSLCGDVRLTYLKNSDHRLSTAEDLSLLGQTLAALCEGVPV